MIIKPGDRQNLFDQMLAAAMKGQPPVTDIGMNDAVIDALIQVALLRTKESADAARAVFDEHYSPDAAKPAVPN